MNDEKKLLTLTVDRVEEGIAVCSLPCGDMTNVPLEGELLEKVGEGDLLQVTYCGCEMVMAELLPPSEDRAAARKRRRSRLNRLFGKK